MKNINIIAIFTLALFACILFSCDNKNDETPSETPPQELIIGKWKSEVHREDGIVVTDANYREFEFSDDDSVVVEEFESDGSPSGSIDDSWTMEVNGDEITVQIDDVIYKVISISESAMTMEYNQEDPFEPGTVIEHSDDLVKI